MHDFGKKKKIPEHKMCLDFIYNSYLKHFSYYEEFSGILSYIYTGLRSTRYSCHILITLEFSGEIFEKSSNKNLLENPSNGRRFAPSDQRDKARDGQT